VSAKSIPMQSTLFAANPNDSTSLARPFVIVSILCVAKDLLWIPPTCIMFIFSLLYEVYVAFRFLLYDVGCWLWWLFHIYSYAQYTLVTKMNSTRSTLWNIECCWHQQRVCNKVDCYRWLCCWYGRLCCWFWQQVDKNLNSTVCRGQLCCRYGRLCQQCVWGQCNTVELSTFHEVDRVEFNFVTSVYWALYVTCSCRCITSCRASGGFMNDESCRPQGFCIVMEMRTSHNYITAVTMLIKMVMSCILLAVIISSFTVFLPLTKITLN